MADRNKGRYLPWWPRDFAADELVIAMTIEAEGAYRRLLDHAWLHGSIPDAIPLLAAICKGVSRRKMNAIWAQIRPCFIPDSPGRLINPKLERVRAEQEAYITQKQVAGRVSAEKRRADKATGVEVPLEARSNAVDVSYQPPTPTPTPTPEKKNNTTQDRVFQVPPELTPDAQDALSGMLRAAQHPDALLAEVRLILQGGRPNVPKDPALVSQALTDLQVAGARVTGMALRAFVRGAKVEQEPKPAREPRTFGNGRPAPPPVKYPSSHDKYRDPYADRGSGGLTVSLEDLVKKSGVVPS